MRATSNNSSMRGWLICIILSLVYFYGFGYITLPAILLRQFIHNYNISASLVGLLSSISFVIAIILVIPIGIVMRYIRGRILFWTLCFFMLASNLILAFSYCYWLALLSRIIAGIGYTGFYIFFIYITQTYLGEKQLPLSSAIINFSGIIGGIVVTIALGQLISHFDWHAIVFYFFIFGAVVIIPGLVFIKDGPLKKHPPKFQFKFMLNSIKKIIRVPSIWVLACLSMLLYIPVAGLASLWGIDFLRQSFHFSILISSLANASIFFGFAIGAILLGELIIHAYFPRLIMFLCSLLCFFCILILLFVPNINVVIVFILEFLLGIFSSSMILTYSFVENVVQESEKTLALSFNQIFGSIGAVISQLFIGLILDWVWSGTFDFLGKRIYSRIDYCYALLIIPVALIFSTILSLFIKIRKPT